ncbi:hypothetical protein BU17DRAFT_49425 [Hysterangium stoloniferum]|nr:hypothetical protein BU17DRAFT_49425 [Hysterangium stoloniferum]
MFNPPLKTPLDPNLLVLNEKELSFFKEQTGLLNDEEVRQRIISVQQKAYEISTYPCVRRFLFAKFNVTRSPAYKRVLTVGKTRKNPIFLDVGCSLGTDIRALISDGYPSQSVVGFDLVQPLWVLGHELFGSTGETFPVPFVEGDILDNSVVGGSEPLPRPPLTTAVVTTDPPSVQGLTNSLLPLHGHVSAIYTGLFFHVFSEEVQTDVARRLAALLSPLPGSIIFGIHVGLPEKGQHYDGAGGRYMFCHSPDSWRTMWEEEIFQPGSVKVEAKIVDTKAEANSHTEDDAVYKGRDNDDSQNNSNFLVWSVERIL